MFFTRRHIKEGKHYRHALQRLINYKRDILSPAELNDLTDLLAETDAALKDGTRTKIAEVQEKIDKAVGKIAPAPPDAGLRENVEVFLVAIIVAAGVRAYFLQPFKIPTGSMQPTLFGIVGHPTDTPPPNIVKRAFDLAWLGRNYIDLAAADDETVTSMKEKTYLNFFTFTTIQTTKNSYTLFAPKDTLTSAFRVSDGQDTRYQFPPPPSSYSKGQAIARGYIDTGDQVFVDKASYNFAPPSRGNVIVFKTTGIAYIQKDLPPGESQHYIKRLAGLPGDTLRIADRMLYINGKIPDTWAFQRVMSGKNGYNGYSSPGPDHLLGTAQDTFEVPAKHYFALGDNSFNSSDSRYWGPLPQHNLAGRGLFVYWPFSSRWGLIH
ncbi:hypothetical protein BH09VER1_BH09VER1_20700 [soil metagenome]